MSKPADEVWEWTKSQLGDKGVLLVTFGVFAIFGAGWAQSQIEHGMDKRVLPLERRQAQYEEDVHEFAKDLRELYRVMPVARRSERLEAPFPKHDDGGER